MVERLDSFSRRFQEWHGGRLEFFESFAGILEEGSWSQEILPLMVQKSGINSPVEGKVVYPIIYREFYIPGG